eukprot:TRINITY_DN1311_c3_g1_i5.p1 TRINITY_DN1311_c3_g1~~TRINITY_DN1311_c3_g1_i5.p1  ORF type:complete len:554 (-),score=161.58 TRINITY_DN1311_c3_g1_i5:117-1778(-)
MSARTAPMDGKEKEKERKKDKKKSKLKGSCKKPSAPFQHKKKGKRLSLSFDSGQTAQQASHMDAMNRLQFGLTPVELARVNPDMEGGVPRVLWQCAECILQSITTEGLFRVPGNFNEVQALKTMVERGTAEVRKCGNVHNVCSLLSIFFRSMTEPVITFDTYNDFVDPAQKYENEQETTEQVVNTIVAAYTVALRKLPHPNYVLLRWFLELLCAVAAFSDENKMAPDNISTVFGPTLMRPQVENLATLTSLKYHFVVVNVLVVHFHDLFAADRDAVPPPVLLSTARPTLFPSDRVLPLVQPRPAAVETQSSATETTTAAFAAPLPPAAGTPKYLSRTTTECVLPPSRSPDMAASSSQTLHLRRPSNPPPLQAYLALCQQHQQSLSPLSARRPPSAPSPPLHPPPPALVSPLLGATTATTTATTAAGQSSPLPPPRVVHTATSVLTLSSAGLKAKPLPQLPPHSATAAAVAALAAQPPALQLQLHRRQASATPAPHKRPPQVPSLHMPQAQSQSQVLLPMSARVGGDSATFAALPPPRTAYKRPPLPPKFFVQT